MKNVKMLKFIMNFIQIMLFMIFGVVIFLIDREVLLEIVKHPVFIILGIFIGGWIEANIHEIGHLIFGLIGEYKFYGYSIGPFNWIKENGKMKFYFEWNNGVLGVCKMSPEVSEVKKKNLLLFLYGGVIANILTVIPLACLLIYSNESIKIMSFLMGMLFITIVLIIMNAFPVKNKSLMSDGNMGYLILTGDPCAEIIMKQITVTKELASSKRPRDIEGAFLADGEYDRERVGMSMQLRAFTYMSALDSGDMDRAKEIIQGLERDIGYVMSVMQTGFYYEFIYYYSICEINEEKAKRYYKKVEKYLTKDKDINGRRVLGAYKYAILKDFEGAKETLNEGLSVFSKFPFKGQALYERDLIKELLKSID